MTEGDDITEVLIAARGGDADAVNRLLPMVYRELERMARGKLAGWRAAQTLDTSGLIGELYIKLVDQSRVNLRDRGHFFAYCATAMRSIVIDRARRRYSEKRGGGVKHVDVEGLEIGRWTRVEEVIAVDEALVALAKLNPRQAEVVELRFFGGMQIDEIAAHLGVAEKTVRRDWTVGRAFLHRMLARMVSSTA